MTRIEDLIAKAEALGDSDIMLAIHELAGLRNRLERYDLATVAAAYMGVTDSPDLESAKKFMSQMLLDAVEDGNKDG